MTGGMAIPMTAAMAITTTTEAGPVMDRDARRLRGQQPRIVTKPKEDKGMAESAAIIPAPGGIAGREHGGMNRPLSSLAVAALILAPLPALAHPGHMEGTGLLAGLLHPLSGMDHLLAMLMVGLWAGRQGGRARLALPAAFLATMLAGFGLGAAGLAMPGMETGILASVIVLVTLAALAVPLPLWAATGIVALAGLLHGQAHGVEGLARPGFVLGVLAASAGLMGLGLAVASVLRRIGLGTGLRRARAA
jgi:urease accessory protein